MKRRDVLTGAGALAVAGCAENQTADCEAGSQESFSWKMAGRPIFRVWVVALHGWRSKLSRLLRDA